MQIKQESEISPNDTVFLDRAIPDALAYYNFFNLPKDEKIRQAVRQASYKKVFILDPLPFVKDSVRTEDEIAQKNIQKLIIDVYESLPFPIVHVPVMPSEERVNFILKNL